MKKTTKRIISFFLCFCMIISAGTVFASANPNLHNYYWSNSFETLYQGASNYQVMLFQRAWQQYPNPAYHNSIDIDGIFGSGTRAAIVNFQLDNNLAGDGIVGPQTWGKLQEYIKWVGWYNYSYDYFLLRKQNNTQYYGEGAYFIQSTDGDCPWYLGSGTGEYGGSRTYYVK